VSPDRGNKGACRRVTRLKECTGYQDNGRETESDIGAISPAEQRMRDILSRPEIGPQARLAALREAGLVPPADGYEVRGWYGRPVAVVGPRYNPPQRVRCRPCVAAW